MHKLKDVLQVWVEHFSHLGTPKESENFDECLFREVKGFISNYNDLSECDDFLEQPFLLKKSLKVLVLSTLIRPQGSII